MALGVPELVPDMLGGKLANLSDIRVNGESEASNTIRFTNGGWQAVSLKDDIYIILTRENTFAALQAVLVGGLNSNQGSYIHTSPDGHFRTFRNQSIFLRYSDTLATMWPDGGSAPYYWVVSPTHFHYIPALFPIISEWIGGSQTNYDSLTFTRTTWTITINGVAYETANYHVSDSVSRPPDTDTGNGVIMSTAYRPQAQANNMVEQVV